MFTATEIAVEAEISFKSVKYCVLLQKFSQKQIKEIFKEEF